jgi:selenide,water dikinase
LGPGDLSRALSGLPVVSDPRLIVGRETFDDAGVFLLSDELALVQTVDFFAPIVDDPYRFGQIAAANALSDIYAMGGEPLTALNIVGFPTGQLDISILTEILRGGQDTVHAAGAFVVGGHSIIDDEVKFGMAVTGRVHPKSLLTNAGAKAGDRLVLTKPIGTGILATAAKKGSLGTEEQETLYASMCSLNREASRVAVALALHCATDVTGFGLLGHALHIAVASRVTLRVVADQVPLLPGTRDAWEAGARTGGADRNVEHLEARVDWGSASSATKALLIDPQTSGGLLVAIPALQVAEYLSRVPGAVEIGEVVPRGDVELVVA